VTAPERWQRIEALFDAALDRDPDDRAAFLAAACGSDDTLRGEVEALLQHAPAAERFLDSSPGQLAARVLLDDDAHSLVGRQIGAYEILSRLGAGGMGEVYRARDPRLRRDVAIKVLPQVFTADPERRARFEREAHLLAALNHPNVGSIYGVEDAGGVRSLVLELVEGPTLADRLAAGPLPLEEALRLARQIAAALGAAHEKAIVHRDLKPTNIKITPSGTVKVLDFGIAKMALGGGAQPDLSAPLGRTQNGLILGTAAYMSPDQARGSAVDERTDIWAFGCVLYEMLAGRPAFGGETVSDTIAAVLVREPDWALLPAATPASLRRLLRRCLEKETARRLGAIGDASVELDDALAVSTRKWPHISARSGRTVIGVAAAVVLASLAVVWFRHSASRTGARPPQSAALKVMPLTTYPGVERDPSFSPDGSRVAFSWNGPAQQNFDIYTKAIGSERSVRLTTDPAEDAAPAWSPDGRWIAFQRSASAGSFSVLLIPALGGPEQKLADVSISADPKSWLRGPYVAWLPDSQFLVISDTPRQGPVALFLLSILTGERKQLTFPPAAVIGDACPAVSPDGKALAFCRSTAPGVVEVYMVALGRDLAAHGEVRQLTSDHTMINGVAWTPDSRTLLLASDRAGRSTLWRLPLDASAGGLAALDVGGGPVAWPAVSRQGSRLAFSQSVGGAPSIWRMRVPSPDQRIEQPLHLIASTTDEFAPQYSPDGGKIAFESHRSGTLEIWVCDSQGKNCMQLTSMGSPYTGLPSWSPDGRQIAFYSRVEGRSQIFVIGAEGGATRRLTLDESDSMFPRWSRDGQWIYYGSNRTGTNQVWRIPSLGGTPVQVTRNGGYASSESPDGKMLYYTRDLSDVHLWKMPVAGGEETQVLESVILHNYAVADDGVYFIAKTAGGLAIQFLNFQTNIVRALAAVGLGYYGFSVAPDRKWILYTEYNPLGSNLALVDHFR
jgi:Tol biopolymer transport system component